MKKLLILCLVITMFTLTACKKVNKNNNNNNNNNNIVVESSSEQPKKIETENEIETPKENISQKFILLKHKSTDNSLCDIYIKDGSSDIKLLNLEVDRDTPITYIKNGQYAIFMDSNNNLIKCNLAGETEVIARELYSKYTINQTYNYKVSDDEASIAYIKQDYYLYLKQGNNAEIKLESNVVDYKFVKGTLYYQLSNGELYGYADNKSEKIYEDVYLFLDEKEYITIQTNNKLAIYKDKVLEEISDDCVFYEVSENKNYIIYSNSSNEVYIKQIGKDAVYVDKFNNSIYALIFDNGNAVIQSAIDQTPTSERNDYYFEYELGKLSLLGTDLKAFEYVNDKFYYADKNYVLYEKEQDKEAVKILDSVYYLQKLSNGIAIFTESNEIYSYIDSNLVKLNDSFSEIMESPNRDHVIYKKDNSYYINENLIAENIDYLLSEEDTITYTTEDNKLFVYSIKDNKSYEVFNDITQYSKIYAKDSQLFCCDLSINDFAGFWKVDSPEEETVIYFDIAENTIVEYCNGEKIYTPYEINDNSKEEYVVNVATEDGNSGTLNKSVYSTSIYFYDYIREIHKISDEEGNKFIADYE